ncbi:hypothetical protein FRC08_009520 [Ceratobasidium sp. 394]|nr:hypothetical protein FRC08_009520 [Ceratobasidium sp. 394]KAG9077120.1 hypothetical protein FS749_011024 [Ceratobasidium sp. UAMH 11750]
MPRRPSGRRVPGPRLQSLVRTAPTSVRLRSSARARLFLPACCGPWPAHVVPPAWLTRGIARSQHRPAPSRAHSRDPLPTAPTFASTYHACSRPAGIHESPATMPLNSAPGPGIHIGSTSANKNVSRAGALPQTLLVRGRLGRACARTGTVAPARDALRDAWRPPTAKRLPV